MELRKDPITRSWVFVGEEGEPPKRLKDGCPLCPSGTAAQVVSSMPPVDGGPWSARALVHPNPLYRIEGDPARKAQGLYDVMRSVGAHELLVENPQHQRQLWDASDAEVAQFINLVAHRIQDLKKDTRFKYVTFFKNLGVLAGEEFEHPTSQITATTYVPRRVLYELRSSRDYFGEKERCVFCDVLGQELKQNVRVLETIGNYVAACPFAPRVPYETWIMPRSHEACFEREFINRAAVRTDLASILRRTLKRITGLTDAFHMVLHTIPNTYQKSSVLGYWKTIDEDYHWHIEILPVLSQKMRSYVIKEVYFSPISGEEAAQRLRQVAI